MHALRLSTVARVEAKLLRVEHLVRANLVLDSELHDRLVIGLVEKHHLGPCARRKVAVERHLQSQARRKSQHA